MFDLIAAYNADIIAVVLLWMVGTSIGNYACSVIYRLPRGQTPFEKHPYCGHCGTMLKPIDLFPVLSYLLAGGKCRYCSGKIPSIYTWVEVICAGILIGYYFIFGMGDLYLVYSAAAIFAVTMASVSYAHGFISSFLYCITALLLLIAEALGTGAVFPAIQSYVVVMVFGLLLYAGFCRMKGKKMRVEEANAVWWFALLALVVPFGFLPVFGSLVLLVAFLAAIGGAHSAVHAVIPCVIVTMIGVMNLL